MKNRNASLNANERTFSDFLTLLKKGLFFDTWHSPEGFPLEDYISHQISLKPPGKTRSPEVLTDLSSSTAADYITGASSRRRCAYLFISSEPQRAARLAGVGKAEGETREAPFYRCFCHARPWNIQSLPSDFRNLISDLLPRLLFQRLDL